MRNELTTFCVVVMSSHFIIFQQLILIIKTSFDIANGYRVGQNGLKTSVGYIFGDHCMV